MKAKISKIITVFFLLFSINTTVLAANLNLNVDFDGKKIEMTSSTPEMEWAINNMLPGQKEETSLIINSIGSKEVKVELNAKIIEGEDVADVLNLKIINNKTNEVLYEGKYSNIPDINVKIPAKETNTFKIIVELPQEVGNEFQNKKCVIKLTFIAKGEKENGEKKQNNNNADISIEPENTSQEENAIEEITTDIINPVKTGESHIIYIVLAVLIITLLILVFSFIKTR